MDHPDPGPSDPVRPSNRLAGETSPYLLQHAHDPVDWYPWGPDALARARELDRPIFLSIGYAACHWCHVMERESFEDEGIAALLNGDFVPIKVDREERPDLDAVYMDAVVRMTGSGGWPMSVFLTPAGRPFFGGTYFPPESRAGLPGFRDVLQGVAATWRDRRAEVERAGERLAAVIAAEMRTRAGDSAVDDGVFLAALVALESTFDAANGGWGGPPRFPQPVTIELLLRRHVTDGDASALAMARRTLDRMAAGGIRDHLGGGFARYATDAVWLVPHFEKMLCDNAQLARVYLHAWQVTGERGYLDVATDTLDFIARDLGLPDGTFASSLDADTDGIEGATYVWTADEVDEVLTAAGAAEAADAAGVEEAAGATDAAGAKVAVTAAGAAEAADGGSVSDAGLALLFREAYGIEPRGNWEGLTILSRVRDDDALAERFGSDAADVRARLATARAALRARRATRPQPARDDKALAAWNGMAIAAFADAARLLEHADLRPAGEARARRASGTAREATGAAGESVAARAATGASRGADGAAREGDAARGARYRAIAERAADALLAGLRGPDGRLRRSWKDGRAMHDAVLEDEATLASGLLALYEATFDERWFVAARERADAMLARFSDPDGGFFDTAEDAEALVVRPRSLQDGATPSGNATAAAVLLRLAAWTGDAAYRDAAARTLALVGPLAGRHPTAFAQWLIAMDLAHAGLAEIAIVGDPADPETAALIHVAFATFRPRQVVAVSADPRASEIPLLQARFALEGRPTAFVCHDFACRQPVTEPEALAALLSAGN